MTVTLKLKPEVDAGLLAQASGMPLEQFLLSVVESAAQTERNTAAEQPARVEAVRRMVEFGEKHHPSLDEPITRKLLHEGRCF
jgi:hypothetical protein